jgi:hypothetical protein
MSGGELAQELRAMQATVQALRLSVELRRFCESWLETSRQQPELRRLLCQLVQDAGELETFAGEVQRNGI